MDILTLLPAALQLFGTIENLVQTGSSLKDVKSVVTNPDLLNAFTQIGAQIFPKAAPELHAVAAIVTSYSPSYNKWVQGALNKLVQPSPNLVVDGKYGPRTLAAVQQLQSQLGLKVDGYAGDLTGAAIQFALSRLN